MKLSKNRIKNILKNKNKNQSRKKLHKHKKYFKHSRLSFKNRKKNLRISTIKQYKKYKNNKNNKNNKKRKVYIKNYVGGKSITKKIFISTIISNDIKDKDLIDSIKNCQYHKFLIKDIKYYEFKFYNNPQDIIDDFYIDSSKYKYKQEKDENEKKRIQKKINELEKMKQEKIKQEKINQEREKNYYKNENSISIKVTNENDPEEKYHFYSKSRYDDDDRSVVDHIKSMLE